jgi:predicted Zn-dependent protease
VLRRTAIALIESVDPMIAAAIHWRARDEENAMRMVDEVLANGTPDDDKYALNLRGYVHITNHRYREALDDFAAIMRIDPAFAPAHFMASWAFLEQGDLGRATEEAQKCIDFAPGRHWGYLAMARVHRARGEGDAGAAMFLAVVEKRPDALPPYLQASAFLLEHGRAEDAGRVARAGLRAFPESAVLHATLGDALSRSGDAFQAGRAYRRALQLDGTNARATKGLAALEGGGR